MDDKNIEIQIIHTKAMENDDSFGVRVLIDNEDKSITELNRNDMFRISAILLNVARKFIKNCFYRAFSELKESEDERIRKALIDYFDDANKADENPLQSYGIHTDKAIAWLEKQGEKPQGKTAIEAIKEEKVDNQNCVEPTDKVEPKFHEGDWVVSNTNKDTFLIKSFNGSYCTLEDTKGRIYTPCLPPTEDDYHLWNINDAKDGDVLVSQYNKPFIYNGNCGSCSIGAYCGISIDDKFKIATGKYTWAGNVNIHPATKEQQDILMKAIDDADYKWDAEKKELKPTK